MAYAWNRLIKVCTRAGGDDFPSARRSSDGGGLDGGAPDLVEDQDFGRGAVRLLGGQAGHGCLVRAVLAPGAVRAEDALAASGILEEDHGVLALLRHGARAARGQAELVDDLSSPGQIGHDEALHGGREPELRGGLLGVDSRPLSGSCHLFLQLVDIPSESIVGGLLPLGDSSQPTVQCCRSARYYTGKQKYVNVKLCVTFS